MLAFFGVLCLGLAAAAQAPAAHLVLPSDDGLPGVLGTHASYPLRGGSFAAGGTARLSDGLGMIEGGNFYLQPGNTPLPVTDARSYAGRFFLAAGLGYGLDASLSLPAYYEYLAGPESPPDRWGRGDFGAVVAYAIPLDLPFVSFSLSGTGSAPTSSRSGPRLPKDLAFQPASGSLPDPVSRTLGMGRPRAGMGAGVSFDLSDAMEGPRLELHANAGFERTLAPGAESPLGVLSASFAGEAYLLDALRLEGELRHRRLVADPSAPAIAYGRATVLALGLGGKAGGGFSLRAGALVAPLAWNPFLPLRIRSRTGEERTVAYRLQPDLAAYLQVAWQGFPLGRDSDHDGVPDGRDLCPAEAEDRDGFQDEDGCPDPDNDRDGVPDARDACPYVPEDHDGFEDLDGCPETDNDHDGFLDAVDKCPNDPEDKDGFQDEDGCPDLDDDRDGIPDAVDKCPREAENRNGVEDEDGCPELDSDGDRIPDSRDKCPHEAEIINFYQDEDGCPDERPEPIRDAVLPGVRFAEGSAELDPSSYPVLDALAARLSAYPGTEIEVQGYLDDRAGPRAKALSRERAESVVEYLVGRGIEARRLKAIGFGSANPIASNRTAQGRIANRRIQIRRLN